MSQPTVLAIAAHPDDIEFLMAGTLMRLREAGYALHYWNLANGCCGTSQHSREAIARMRRQEAMVAAESLGAVFHESICDDLGIFYAPATLAKVASVIRQVRPRMVLTHAPVDYMEDHTNTCRLAVTAAFARGMPNFVADPPHEHYGDPVTVYHAQPYSHYDPLGDRVRPHMYVDVSDLQDRKRALLACHASQKVWLDESQSHDSYLQAMSDLDADLARETPHFAYAEGWRKHLHMGFCGPADDPLREALAPHIYLPRDATA